MQNKSDPLMYHTYYLFRVPRKNVDRFLRVVNDAGAVYREHGAVASTEVMRLTDGSNKYGCLGLNGQVHANAEEQVFFGVDSFHNREQLHALTIQIEADSRIQKLFKEIQEIIEPRESNPLGSGRCP